MATRQRLVCRLEHEPHPAVQIQGEFPRPFSGQWMGTSCDQFPYMRGSHQIG